MKMLKRKDKKVFSRTYKKTLEIRVCIYRGVL